MRLLLPGLIAGLLACGEAPALDLPAPGETHCYGRVYDEAHLRKNPQQLVRSLVLELFQWKEFEGINFWVRVELADDGLHNWWSSGACHDDAGRLICAIDCDGGSFHLEAGKEGAVLLRNDTYGFVVQMSCGEELPEEPHISHITADAANATYRLVPLPDDFCPDYEFE